MRNIFVYLARRLQEKKNLEKPFGYLAVTKLKKVAIPTLKVSATCNIKLSKGRVTKTDLWIQGFHEAKKDPFNEEFQAWDYSMRGKTIDGRNLRIVIAIVQPNVLVVTTIDLDAKDD